MEELTLHQVADELGVHYMTAYRYVRLGMLPARREGREWRVRRADLEAMRAPREVSDDQDGAPWEERLTARLLEGDEAGAWWVMEAAMAAGAAPEDVLEGALTEALHSIGELWESGEIGVDQEHTASSVALRLVGRLGGRFARRGVTRGVVVLGTTPDELHGLPLAVAAEVIRQAGFQVLDLGPRLPTEAFVAAVKRAPMLVAVGVGATTAGQLESLRATISAIKEAVDVPIVVGGGAVGSRQEALDLGGDAWVPEAGDFLEVLGDQSSD
ncbi:MAG TPA: B12-binding domain-containing protein [Acidimicrobiia bacterium]|nr:B12-binding domain-containing protein [Acidimicrobiia bacterium]